MRTLIKMREIPKSIPVSIYLEESPEFEVTDYLGTIDYCTGEKSKCSKHVIEVSEPFLDNLLAQLNDISVLLSTGGELESWVKDLLDSFHKDTCVLKNNIKQVTQWDSNLELEYTDFYKKYQKLFNDIEKLKLSNIYALHCLTSSLHASP